jgi:hypothetical protein
MLKRVQKFIRQLATDPKMSPNPTIHKQSKVPRVFLDSVLLKKN